LRRETLSAMRKDVTAKRATRRRLAQTQTAGASNEAGKKRFAAIRQGSDILGSVISALKMDN